MVQDCFQDPGSTEPYKMKPLEPILPAVIESTENAWRSLACKESLDNDRAIYGKSILPSEQIDLYGPTKFKFRPSLPKPLAQDA